MAVRKILRPLVDLHMPILQTENGGVRACLEIDKAESGMWVVNVNNVTGRRGHRQIIRVEREECDMQAHVLDTCAEVVIKLEREWRIRCGSGR